MRVVDPNKPSESDIQFAIKSGKDPEKIKCWTCFDGEFFPQYGRAPHQSFIETTLKGKMADDLPQSKWPDNFEPDWDDIPESERESYTGPMCGVWYCPNNCEHGGKAEPIERSGPGR